MSRTTRSATPRLPGRFEDLVRLMPPEALVDEAQHDETLAMVDRLMSRPHLTKGQARYLETLVQLVQAYEATQHAVDLSDLGPLDSLRHLLQEHEMNGSDLARLLGVHPSLGSKILRGERSLTVEHLKTLAEYFRVSPAMFIA